MPTDNFPDEVVKQLKFYVYRLIDPRNGETFYVGMGRGNRIFVHAKGEFIDSDSPDLEEREDAVDLNLQRIKKILAVGLEVGHVVHRHGIERSDVAYEIEAALIDAYPGLTNRVEGQGSGDYGSRHVEEIIAQYAAGPAQYAAEPFEVTEPLILISISNSYYSRNDVYDAVRSAWKINVSKAGSYKLVLGHVRGLVVGAYRPEKWLEATKENFPGILTEDEPGRRGFVGKPAETAIWDYYVNKRVPERYRRRGARAPVRYCDPNAA